MHISFISLLLAGSVFLARAQAIEEPESELANLLKRSEDTLSDEPWVDLTTGVMMQEPNGSGSAGLTGLTKRSVNPTQRETSEIYVKRDTTTGSLALPRTWDQFKRAIVSSPQLVSRHVKRGARHVARSMKVVITWYTGHDLLAPSCVQKSSWAPTDKSMVGAVTIEWSNKPACGRFVRIRHANNKKKVIVVRIVDSCAGCASGSAHIDLTIGAFTKLYDLDVGIVSGLQAQLIDPPIKHKWTQADVQKFGPQYI